MSRWISIKEDQPIKNMVVHCKIDIWRYGRLDHKGLEYDRQYVGLNDITNTPMFDFDDNDCYEEVTHWKSIIND